VLVHNALGYASRVAAFWSNGYSKPAAAALCLAASVLALVGFVHRVRERVTVLESLTVIYLAVILAWPSYQGQRYLYPLAPLYLFYAVLGLRHAGWRGRLARPWQAAPDNAVLTRAGKPPVAPRAVAARGWVTAVLLLAVAASYLARYTTMDFRDLKQGVAKQESADLFEYIRTQTGKDDVIVFIKPRAMALFGQRRCSAYHVVADDRQLWDYFRRIDARYVVVVKDENTLKDFEFPEVVRFLGEFVRRNRSRFEWPPVYENADFAVYRIRPAVPHAQFGSKSNDTRGSHACTASMP